MEELNNRAEDLITIKTDKRNIVIEKEIFLKFIKNKIKENFKEDVCEIYDWKINKVDKYSFICINFVNFYKVDKYCSFVVDKDFSNKLMQFRKDINNEIILKK